MKSTFLRDLNRKLRCLKKTERKKYLENYAEMISDKIESGDTEENALKSLENITVISENILQSYQKKETGVSSAKYFNKWYMAGDIASFLTAFILTYIFYSENIATEAPVYFSPDKIAFLIVLIGIVVICFSLYCLSGLYTIEGTRSYKKEAENIMCVNGMGFIVFFLILYLFKVVFIPRIFVVVYAGVNMILGMLVRGCCRKI